MCDPWGLGVPQKTCIFGGLGAVVNHHSVATSYDCHYFNSLLYIDGTTGTICRQIDTHLTAFFTGQSV